LTPFQTGFDIEYYVHEYKPQESTATSAAATTPATSGDGVDAKKYTFRFLKKSILPTFPNTFTHMSLSLESLAHYKVRKKKRENVVKVEMGSLILLENDGRKYCFSF
jgi:hypothetical protein